MTGIRSVRVLWYEILGCEWQVHVHLHTWYAHTPRGLDHSGCYSISHFCLSWWDRLCKTRQQWTLTRTSLQLAKQLDSWGDTSWVIITEVVDSVISFLEDIRITCSMGVSEPSPPACIIILLCTGVPQQKVVACSCILAVCDRCQQTAFPCHIRWVGWCCSSSTCCQSYILHNYVLRRNIISNVQDLVLGWRHRVVTRTLVYS